MLVAERSVFQFTPRNLANTLWAVAKMNLKVGSCLLNLLSGEVHKKMHDFNAQNIANTLWAFSNLGKL